MKKNPLVSFCIATYQRPEFLKSTIQSILSQKYTNIEIIVSDNDPLGSSKKVVTQLKNTKITYSKNKENIGMVKNFNKALSLATGDLITFVADDDPIEKDMLATLIPLYHQFPDADNFFGASNVYITDSDIAKTLGFHKGLTSLKSNIQKDNEIRTYTPDTFLRKFFTYQVTSYFLWSTGFAKKDLVKKIGGMPDYGSPFLTDYTYVCMLGTLGKTVLINKELGRQTIHSSNFGQTYESIKNIPTALKGMNKMLDPYIQKYQCEREYQTFINNWTIDHLTGLNNRYREQGKTADKKALLAIYHTITHELPFFKKRQFELKTKIYLPQIAIPLWKLNEKIRRRLKRINT